MTATYEKIATSTLGSAAASISFTSISGSYTDLVIVLNGSITSASAFFQIQMGNGSVDTTGSNYSATRLYGNGTAASSDRYTSSQPAFAFGITGTNQSNAIIQINNYSNTTTFKTTLVRFSQPNGDVGTAAQLWRSTVAITAVTLVGGANFSSGTTATIYGILKEA